jgi:hypothetical protein
MNAERLHAMAKALKAELAQTEAPALLQQLDTALQALVQEPAQPSHQQTISTLRQQLDAALASAPSNDFSPAWREALEELDVSDLVGETLREQIQAIFERNEITPSAAAQELTPLAQRLQAFDQALDSLIASFEFFGIGAEELAPGEFEVGFLVPRAAVDEELGALGKEFVQLKRILGPFLELTTGNRPDVRVRSIASSEFQVLLDSAPAAALMIATALERLISSYEKVLQIRLAHQTLRESGVAEKTLDSVSKEAEKLMEKDIAELVEELLAQGEPPDPGRANELRKDLQSALNGLANRIDRGYGVEVRTGELPQEAADEDVEVDPDLERRREMAEKVLAAQKRLSFRNPTGKPILELPESGLEDDDSEAP